MGFFVFRVYHLTDLIHWFEDICVKWWTLCDTGQCNHRVKEYLVILSWNSLNEGDLITSFWRFRDDNLFGIKIYGKEKITHVWLFWWRWHRPFLFRVRFLHRTPFKVIPVHWVEVIDLLDCLVFPTQQFVPTIFLWILQTQLFDLLRLHGLQRSWMFEGSFFPPHENGVMWSYSKFSLFPQHWHLPPSRVKTIFLVVVEIYLLWENPEKLIRIRDIRRSNLFKTFSFSDS